MNSDSTSKNPCLEQQALELQRLSDEVGKILARNARVELDKRWETSRTRLASITAVTYITTALVFWSLDAVRPFAQAFVPTTGFFLSTLSLPFVRRIWQRRSEK